MGFFSSGLNLPRISIVIKTGISEITTIAAPTIVNVFVNASGLNNFPSCPVNKKTGRNETKIISSEKKIARPTCFAESIEILLYSSFVRFPFSAIALAMFRYEFSTSTIDESTITPIARMMPPRLIIFELMSKMYIKINEIKTAIGISISILTTLLQCRRNIATIIDTTIAASINALSRVAIASPINVLLSYEAIISTPGGSPVEISFIFSFTRSITFCAFSSVRITIIPPTTSPSPFFSSAPRRMSLPS